jgi:hypothetical protein
MDVFPPGYARFRPLLEAAVDGRFHTIDHLDWMIRTGRAQYWQSAEAAMATELRDYPGCRAIHGLAAAGDLYQIRSILIPAAEAWGRSQGCSWAIVESRPGWQRALRNRGYEPHQIAVVKGL